MTAHPGPVLFEATGDGLARVTKGYRSILDCPNTSPAEFRDFMIDRVRVERLKGIMGQFSRPVQRPSSLEPQ